MRKRTLVAIVLVMFALPTFGSDPRRPVEQASADPEALVAIADLRLAAAFDAGTAPAVRDRYLASALRDYELALSLDAKHRGALLGLARYYARTKQKGRAADAYEIYFRHYPTDTARMREAADACAKWHDWNAAIKWCNRALTLDPADRAARKTVALCLANAGMHDTALRELCRIMPEAEARVALAGVLKQQSQPAECKQQLQLALRADPTYTPARELLREMRIAAAPSAPAELPLLRSGWISSVSSAFYRVEPQTQVRLRVMVV